MKLLTAILLLISAPVTTSAQPVVITAVGDIMLAGSGEAVYRKRGYDYAFAATRNILMQSDIVTGNLESPLTTHGVEFTEKKFRFKTPPEAVTALKSAGFTYLSLANNHIADFGPEGLMQTLATLDSQNILHSGAGENLMDARKAAIVDIRGIRVALLAYSLTHPQEFFAGSTRPGTAPGYLTQYTNDIRKAKEHADCVIVSFHWGGEGENSVKPYQRSTARKAIDAGADIIIGHHPHILQGVEYYRKGIIFYSLGNFVFGSLSKTSSLSIIARITFNQGISEVEIIPLNVRNSEVRFQPRRLGGINGEKAVGMVDALSSPMGSRVVVRQGRFLVQPRSD